MDKVIELQTSAYNAEYPAYDQMLKPAIFNFFKTNQFTDITLSAEGKFVHCHQVVLAAISPYFEKMFKIRELAVRPLIVFGDIYFEDLLGLLRYIYTGKISVLESHLERFIKAGQTLQVKGFETVRDKFEDGNEVSSLFETTPQTVDNAQSSNMPDATENMPIDDDHPNGQELDKTLQGELKALKDNIEPKSRIQVTSIEKIFDENLCTEKIISPSKESAETAPIIDIPKNIVTSEELQTHDQSETEDQSDEEKKEDNVTSPGSCQLNPSLEDESILIINDTDFNLTYSEPCKFCGKVVEGSSGIEKKLKQHQKRCLENPKHESGMCVICEKFIGENRLARHFNVKHGVP